MSARITCCMEAWSQRLLRFHARFSCSLANSFRYLRAERETAGSLLLIWCNACFGPVQSAAVADLETLGNLSKLDGNGWRQGERHKTKGLISKTATLHVRYRFWYISLPSSAKQQREMIKFKVLCRTWTHDSEFSFFYLNRYAVLTESALGLFAYIRQIERVETIAKKFEIFRSHFWSDVFLGVAVVVA